MHSGCCRQLNVADAAPGQLISIFGDGLGPEAAVAAEPDAAGVWPRAAGGGEVLFDGVAAAVLYASEPQVNVQVPHEVAGRTATRMELRRNGETIDARVLRLAERSPSVFVAPAQTCNGLTFFALSRNQDSQFNACNRPAAPDSELT